MFNRHIYRFITVFLISAAILSPKLTAQNITDALTIFPPTETRINIGSETVMPISIMGAQDLGALQFELVYDEQILEIVNINNGPGMPPVLLDFNVVEPGLLRVALAGSEPIEGDTRLEVHLLGLAAGSGTIQFQEVQAWELATGYEMLTESRSGQVIVSTGLPVSKTLIAVVLILFLITIAVIIIQKRKGKASSDET